MKTWTVIVIAVLVALFVTACGRAGGGDDAPVAAVRNLIGAVEELDLDRAKEYLCAEQRTALEEDMEGGFAELEQLGISRDELLDAFRINLEDLEFEQKSQSGDTAVVGFTGNMSLQIDEDKLGEFVRSAAEASGQDVSDEQVDFMVGMLTAAAGEEQSIDGEVELVQEDGKWLVCSELDFLGQTDFLNMP